ncbi:alpha/beta hydrolase [Arthrobacter zhangbolii]|uniref:Alpha/beta hydrolase n=1 Tax=Arthrobacter zhangbolii TaxID=2886936 RepID=A0A9X1S8G1_9MICC|nr:alpha/beta hydrolase [Arthrobacter zhangbolii]MCC3271873.1 alpha/beta hydrolase [Arthrobacter zhangbolii]UON93630.1 alpha/beta hydrolase [Arthrobacter zhangbolii]
MPMRLLVPYLRLTRKPLTATVRRARQRLAADKHPAPPPRRLRGRYGVQERTVNGFTCWSVFPRTPRPSPAPLVMYLHGGAYTSPITGWHWRFIARLAAAGYRVEVPLYGLAPKFNHRDATPFLTAVYRKILSECPPGAVAFMGDSSGGGLALAFAQQLAGLSLPPPGRLVLLSPWVDLAMQNPELAEVEARDPWLSRTGLRVSAEAWAAGDPLNDPRVSPLNGSFSGLPATELFSGTSDLPYPDILRLEKAMLAGGCRVNLHIAEGGVHVYPLLPVPEGRAARNRILAVLGRARRTCAKRISGRGASIKGVRQNA